MTKPSEQLTCPLCAAELSIEQLFANEETRRAFARLAAISMPVGSKVLAYVSLFAPLKNRMTIARKVRLIEELLPDLVRGAIDHKGREWLVSHDDWRDAIDRILQARDARKITLPLTSHGYLYETLCGMSDRVESIAERARESDRRARPHTTHTEGPQTAHAALSEPIPTPRTAAPAVAGTSPLVRRMRAAAAITASTSQPTTTEGIQP